MEETDEYDSVQWDIHDATTATDGDPLEDSRQAETATIDPLSDIADSMNSTLKLDNTFDSTVCVNLYKETLHGKDANLAGRMIRLRQLVMSPTRIQRPMTSAGLCSILTLTHS
jgi:hypothetical protein